MNLILSNNTNNYLLTLCNVHVIPQCTCTSISGGVEFHRIGIYSASIEKTKKTRLCFLIPILAYLSFFVNLPVLPICLVINLNIYLPIYLSTMYLLSGERGWVSGVGLELPQAPPGNPTKLKNIFKFDHSVLKTFITKQNLLLC